MAIHFNYIKGLNGNVTKLSTDTTTSDSDDLYTFIKWAGRTSNANPDKDAKYLPHIYIARTNALGNNDLGHIITSNATNQIIQQDLQITKDKKLNFSTIGSLIGTEITNTNTKNKVFQIAAGQDASMELITPISLTIKYHTTKAFTINENMNDVIISYRPLRIDDDSDPQNYVEIREGNITAAGHIDSLYFNATSDQRAKSHIQLFKSSALDIVNKLPVYEFHYRNNDTPSIGVLAQDAVTFDEQFTDFSLVNNPDATGEDGDFMTIKESKLVYILWKAVQEQQEQIIQLQAELNTIISSIKNR